VRSVFCRVEKRKFLYPAGSWINDCGEKREVMYPIRLLGYMTAKNKREVMFPSGSWDTWVQKLKKSCIPSEVRIHDSAARCCIIYYFPALQFFIKNSSSPFPRKSFPLKFYSFNYLPVSLASIYFDMLRHSTKEYLFSAFRAFCSFSKTIQISLQLLFNFFVF
jgi:hypothetical protein